LGNDLITDEDAGLKPVVLIECDNGLAGLDRAEILNFDAVNDRIERGQKLRVGIAAAHEIEVSAKLFNAGQGLVAGRNGAIPRHAGCHVSFKQLNLTRGLIPRVLQSAFRFGQCGLGLLFLQTEVFGVDRQQNVALGNRLTNLQIDSSQAPADLERQLCNLRRLQYGGKPLVVRAKNTRSGNALLQKNRSENCSRHKKRRPARRANHKKVAQTASLQQQ
jgi:hypothetical protein